MQYDDNTARRTVLAAAAGGAAAAASAAPWRRNRAQKVPRSGSTWTSRRSTTPTTRPSMPPTATRSAKRRVANSDKARAVIGAPERVAYGATEIEKLDIYRTERQRQCAGQYLHSRRGMAGQSRRRLCVPRRAVREGGRALRHSRFHQCRRDRRRPLSHGRAGAPRGRLGLPECGKLRRRSQPALSHLAFLRLPSRRLRGDARLAQGRPAGRHPQGRGARERHVRSQAGAALEALEIRQVHRRDGAGAERAAPHRQAHTRR